MVPFAIAGIQMEISTQHENITAMGRKLDILMARFPWVQMVLFSELAPYGPSPYHAQPTGGHAEQIFCQMAAKHGVWLLPGSIFERVGDDIYNTTSVIDPSGKVVTRTMLLEEVWDYHFDPQTNVIDVHVSRLRSKIDKDFDKQLLHTVRGSGYILRDPDAVNGAGSEAGSA